jgi:hypothetical protein
MAEIIRIGLAIDDRGGVATLRATETGLQRVGLAADGGSRGINKIERALSALAFQAAGIPGPIGSLSTALLQFGIGGTVTLGFVAGFAAMTLAMRAFGRAAEEEQERVGELLASVERLTRAPGADALVQRLSLRTIIREGEDRLAATRQVFDLSRVGPGAQSTRTENILQGAARNQVERNVEGARTALRALDAMAASAARAATFLDRLAFAAGAGFALTTVPTRTELNAIRATGMAGTLGVVGTVAGGMAAFPGTRNQGVMRPGDFDRIQRMAQADAMTNFNTLRNPTFNPQRGMDLASGLGLAASGVATLGGIAGRGSAVGSGLMGIGGIVGAIPGGQVAGGAIALVGALVSAFTKARPLPTRDDELNRRFDRLVTGPQQVTVIVSNSRDVGAAIESAKRAQRRDAFERVPADAQPPVTG